MFPNRRKVGYKEIFIKCPHCGSTRTGMKVPTDIIFFLGLVSVCTIITFPIGILLLLSIPIIKKFTKEVTVKCDKCGHSFLVSKEEINKYEKELNRKEKIHIEK